MELLGMKCENIAQFNNKLIVNLLLQEPLSCVELAEKTNLSHMATGRILRRLLEMDMVKPYVEQLQKRSRGRQFFRYEINAERAYYICINLQHGSESFIIYDLAGNVVHSEQFETKIVYNDVVDDLNEKIKGVLSDRGISIDHVAVVSVSIPGRVNSESGKIIVSSKVDKSVVLKDKVKEAFPNAKIAIRNDIDYACIYSILSEEFDYSKGTHLYLYIGSSGIACCTVYEKNIICGASGFGGEIGMNTVDKNGDRLHSAVSICDMLDFCRKVTGNDEFSLSDIKNSYDAYPEIKSELLKVAETLGRDVCNHIDIIGSSHIIFAGAVTNYPKVFFDAFLAKLKDTNYSGGIEYKLEFSPSEETGFGQMLLARLNSLDWVMEQY